MDSTQPQYETEEGMSAISEEMLDLPLQDLDERKDNHFKNIVPNLRQIVLCSEGYLHPSVMRSLPTPENFQQMSEYYSQNASHVRPIMGTVFTIRAKLLSELKSIENRYLLIEELMELKRDLISMANSDLNNSRVLELISKGPVSQVSPKLSQYLKDYAKGVHMVALEWEKSATDLIGYTYNHQFSYLDNNEDSYGFL